MVKCLSEFRLSCPLRQPKAVFLINSPQDFTIFSKPYASKLYGVDATIIKLVFVFVLYFIVSYFYCIVLYCVMPFFQNSSLQYFLVLRSFLHLSSHLSSFPPTPATTLIFKTHTRINNFPLYQNNSIGFFQKHRRNLNTLFQTHLCNNNPPS